MESNRIYFVALNKKLFSFTNEAAMKKKNTKEEHKMLFKLIEFN